MTRQFRSILFFALASLTLLAAAGLFLSQAAEYNNTRNMLPPGSIIAGIPVGGLSRSDAGTRLVQAYALTPVEIQIQGSRIHIDPVAAGLKLDLEGMFKKVDQELAARSYWAGLWEYLLNRPAKALDIELICSVDENQSRGYLTELLMTRYDQPPTPAVPLPGDSSFQAGQPGIKLDIEAALPELSHALCSPDSRYVTIKSTPIPALPPSIDHLQTTLEALIQVSGFDGILELYFEDLQTGENFSLAAKNGQMVEPGIAFTAASTIKIPVMVSVYRQMDTDLPADLQQRLALMIDLSDNSSTDEVMQRVLDTNLAPIQVTQDASALGLKNTFLAGFFFPGAPLLDLYKTPANQRTDLSTDPDIYNQTTAADMGHLLAGIQQCAEDGTGLLINTFSGEITQAECQAMVELLLKNRKGVLIEAGLPEGTPIAHKYGWVTDPVDGLMHQASDAALVFTPGGNFVMTIYLHHPEQLQWDPSQRLAARLATAIYNFYNQWR